MIRLSLLSLLALLVGCATDPKDTGGDDTGSDSGDTGTDTGDSGDTGTDTGDSGDTGDDTGTAESIAVAGTWTDNWGGEHVVADDAWAQGDSLFAITRYDNEGGWAVAQNAATNEWNPGLWSRFDWGWSDGELLVCQTAYAAASEADALATPAADLSSPDSGCGGFSWSVLRPRFSLTDTWDDSWGGQHVVDAFVWGMGDSTFAVSQLDEAGRWLVAQNGATNDWNPDLWSRFDWAWTDDGALFYCQTAYAAATESDALATPAADATDLAGGCGGFAWTELRPALSIDGAWADGWGGRHSITAFTWTSGDSRFDITVADDAAGWLVARNADTNAWSPGLWSRFDWTWDDVGTLWYCQTAYDAASEADALATPAADPTSPATTGCGSFAWTSMEPS